MESLLFAFSIATQTFNLPPGLLSAICFSESRHEPRAINPNDGGSSSLGVCQIKLATARLVGYKGTERDLLYPGTNIYYAAKYLKKQLNRYNGDIPRAVSAYNAGRFNKAPHGGPRNSRYVNTVLSNWAKGH